MIGKSEDGYCVAFESFSFNKMGYADHGMLGPGECIEISCNGIKQLIPPGNCEKFCAFMWTYFGYPTSHYEGDSVEAIRTRGGIEMAKFDLEHGLAENIDSVCGVPDSGNPYEIGYAN